MVLLWLLLAIVHLWSMHDETEDWVMEQLMSVVLMIAQLVREVLWTNCRMIVLPLISEGVEAIAEYLAKMEFEKMAVREQFCPGNQ